MTPDHRILITKMADELDHCQQLLMDDRRQRHPLADRARALLAEPEGTDGEVPRIGHILRLAEIIREVDGKHDKGAAALAEAILSHPGIRSAGLTADLLAELEAEGPSADELIGLALGREPWATWLRSGGCLESAHCELADLMLATIARYGRPTPQPVAEPPAEGPNDEEIISQADKFLAYSDAHMGDPARWEGSDVDLVAFTRHALARWGRPAAAPVAVSERLPGPEDCDAEGRCWLGGHQMGRGTRTWLLGYPAWAERFPDVHQFWLPANALPLPAPEGEDSQP